jgi:hypothetical protein
VVERIFQKLLTAFGNLVTSKWGGLSMDEVYADWADALAHTSIGAIGHAVGLARMKEYPPSLSEFIALTTSYKAPLDDRLQITEQRETGPMTSERYEKIVSSIKNAFGPDSEVTPDSQQFAIETALRMFHNSCERE